MRTDPGESGRGVAPPARAAAAGARPGSSPLRAFAELRATLLWRRLRGRGGVAEVVARVALFAIAIPAGLAFAALAGAGAFQAVRAGEGERARLAVAALLFGVWHTWTAISLSVSDRDAADLRRFLAYPIPPGRVFTYGLAASVVGDPFAAFWSLLLAGAFVGAALARPGGWLLLLALAYMLFVVGTAALVALVQELLARLLRGRRVRELAIAFVYVGTAFFLFFASGGPRSAIQALQALSAIRWIAFPPALAERAISALYAGKPGAAAPWLVALAAASLLAAWIAYRLALAAALSGGDPGARAAATGAAGWRIPGRLGPLLEKEGKYLLRHPVAGVLALVVPAFSALIGWKLAPRIPDGAGEVVRALPLMGLAAYAHLATQPFWLNAFGWERGGGRAWFLAPVALADVLVAKNVAVYLLSFALFAAGVAAGSAAGGAAPGWALLGAVALHAGIAPFFLAAGNVVSILNPRPAPHGVQRGGRLSPVSSFAGMAILGAGVGIFSIPVLLAIWIDATWLLPAGWAALGVAGLALYRMALPRIARLLAERREPLLAAVCGDDA
jgi:ABC-2 type transport system permease protein